MKWAECEVRGGSRNGEWSSTSRCLYTVNGSFSDQVSGVDSGTGLLSDLSSVEHTAFYCLTANKALM